MWQAYATNDPPTTKANTKSSDKTNPLPLQPAQILTVSTEHRSLEEKNNLPFTTPGILQTWGGSQNTEHLSNTSVAVPMEMLLLKCRINPFMRKSGQNEKAYFLTLE